MNKIIIFFSVRLIPLEILAGAKFAFKFLTSVEKKKKYKTAFLTIFKGESEIFYPSSIPVIIGAYCEISTNWVISTCHGLPQSGDGEAVGDEGPKRATIQEEPEEFLSSDWTKKKNAEQGKWWNGESQIEKDPEISDGKKIDTIR